MAPHRVTAAGERLQPSRPSPSNTVEHA
jgi:hypothetical protein